MTFTPHGKFFIGGRCCSTVLFPNCFINSSLLLDSDPAEPAMVDSKSASGQVPYWVSLVSGGIAGTTVDICFYPLDTIKTRMQSVEGTGSIS